MSTPPSLLLGSEEELQEFFEAEAQIQHFSAEQKGLLFDAHKKLLDEKKDVTVSNLITSLNLILPTGTPPDSILGNTERAATQYHNAYSTFHPKGSLTFDSSDFEESEKFNTSDVVQSLLPVGVQERIFIESVTAKPLLTPSTRPLPTTSERVQNYYNLCNRS